MKLNKTQQKTYNASIRQARNEAFKTFFTGPGAFMRIVLFCKRGFVSSLSWTSQIIFLLSWGIIAGIFVGPKHLDFLLELRNWIVVTPVDQVIEKAHSMTVFGLLYCVKFGFCIGYMLELGKIVGTMSEQRERYRLSIKLITPSSTSF